MQEYRPTNQSLNAMLTRLLTPEVKGMHRANVASLSPRAGTARWLVLSSILGWRSMGGSSESGAVAGATIGRLFHSCCFS